MRVELRMVRPADCEAVYRLLSQMKVVRWMLFPLFTRAYAHAFVTQLQPVVLGPGRYSLDRAIVTGGDESVIGLCGLVVDRDRDEAEAWYLIDPDYWGKGLGTEAMARLIAIGFDDCGLHRIWGCCVPANIASARVMEKAGMRREGHMRRNLRIHGEWQDSYMYAILREEWSGNSREPAPDLF